MMAIRRDGLASGVSAPSIGRTSMVMDGVQSPKRHESMVETIMAMPVEKELRRLTRWAQVALAARCARRLQPSLELDRPDSLPEHHAAVELAISAAEVSARNGDGAADLPNAQWAIERVVQATKTLVNDRSKAATLVCMTELCALSNRSSSIDAVEAAGAAVAAADYADTAQWREAERIRHRMADDLDSANDAFQFAEGASGSLTYVLFAAAQADRRHCTAVRADFERLVSLQRENSWNDESPVDVHLLGALFA